MYIMYDNSEKVITKEKIVGIMTTRKNIVILGNASSIFVYNYCKEIIQEKYNIIIVSPYDGGIYKTRYNDLGVKIFVRPVKNNLLLFCLDVLGQNVKIINECQKQGVDVLHMHYVCIHDLLLYIILWEKARRKILTFWGTDLFREIKQNFCSKFFLRTSTKCVFMIEQNTKRFFEIFGNKYANKIEIINLGNNNLTYIDNILNEDMADNREKCLTDRFVIHIGYNASKAQNHKEIIKAICMLDEETKSRIVCVLPFNYAKTSDYAGYKLELCNILDENKIDYYIEEQFLEGEKLAAFRCNVNLFILGHLTDGRSESPIEYVYSQVPFLCKKEVSENYNEICVGDDDGYIVYENYDEITNHVRKYVRGEYNLNYDAIEKRREKIRHECSWDSYREEWRKLYE